MDIPLSLRGALLGEAARLYGRLLAHRLSGVATVGLRPKRLVAAAVVAAVLGAMPIAGASARPSTAPTALYRALVAQTFADGTPTGFPAPRRVGYELSDQARRHHAIGGVEFDLGRDAAIIYLVYPSRSDALSDWKETDIRSHGTSSLRAPSGFPAPSVIINYPIVGKTDSGKTVTHGISDLVFTAGNVIVQALTLSPDRSDRGDVPASIRLGRFALRRLVALRAGR
jgi:hypothetical protein